MTKVYLLVEAEVGTKPYYDNLTAEEIAIKNLEEVMRCGATDFVADEIKISVYGVTTFKMPRSLPDAVMEILMRDQKKKPPMHEALMQAVIKDGKKPPKERWQALIDRGAINEDGEVLLKSPLMESEGGNA